MGVTGRRRAYRRPMTVKLVVLYTHPDDADEFNRHLPRRVWTS
jgi:hypothetical protein